MSRNDPGETTESERAVTPTAPAGPMPTGFDGVASYEDGDATVICDRQAPAAWIRSTVTVPVRR